MIPHFLTQCLLLYLCCSYPFRGCMYDLIICVSLIDKQFTNVQIHL